MSPSPLLDRVRNALSFDERRAAAGLRLTGVGQLSGLSARFVFETHGDGRAVERVTSRLPSARGFDGARGWSLDSTGLVAPMELGDLVSFRLFDALLSGRWLAHDGPVEVTERSTFGRHELLLRWRGDARRFVLTLDADTARPSTLRPASGPPSIIHLRRFERGDGCATPRELVFETGHLVDRLTLDVATRCEDVDARPPPTAEPTWHAGDHRLRLSRTRRGRLPLVDLVLDGRSVGPFLLDTGAGAMALDAGVADALALPSRGRTWVTTTDGGTGACFRVARSLRIGALEVASPVFLELDLAPLREALGVRLAGIVGYDVFARAVVHLSEGGAGLQVLRPDATDDAPLRWLPLRFEDRCPLVACESAHGGGLFALDTGSAAAVTCYAEAARAWGIAPRGRRSTAMIGASGARAVTTRRLPWFAVGDMRFEAVAATFDLAREGLGGIEGRLGTVGYPLLAGLDLFLDAPNARVALRRPAPR